MNGSHQGNTCFTEQETHIGGAQRARSSNRETYECESQVLLHDLRQNKQLSAWEELSTGIAREVVWLDLPKAGGRGVWEKGQ